MNIRWSGSLLFCCVVACYLVLGHGSAKLASANNCTPGRSVDRAFWVDVVQKLENPSINGDPMFAVEAILEWMPFEGTSACWNPLGSTQVSSGATNFNSVGVKNYATREAGIEATAVTLNYGIYRPIRKMLARQEFNEAELRQAIRCWVRGCNGTGHGYADSLIPVWRNLYQSYTSCSDAAEFVHQSEYPIVFPRRPFSIFFEVRNTGTCTWKPGDYYLAHAGGATLGAGSRYELQQEVLPNQVARFTITDMQALLGLDLQYRTEWELRHGEQFFGPDMHILVTVVSSSDSDNSPENANTLPINSLQNHTIFPADDVDWFRFDLNNQSGILLKTDVNGDEDTRLWLFDSSLRQIDYNDDYDSGQLFSVILRRCGGDALPAGTYYAKVDEYGNDDEISYSIELRTETCSSPDSSAETEGDAGNNRNNSTPLYPNAPQTHSIMPATDIDWFQFTLDDLSAINMETSGNNGDTRLWLYSNSDEIAYNDDSDSSLFSLINLSCENALSPGTYYVKVDSYQNANIVPNYTLSLDVATCHTAQNNPDDNPQNAIPLSTNTPQSHTISPASDVDWFQFRLNESSGILLKTNTDGDTRLWLFDSNLSQVDYNDDYGDGDYFSVILRQCGNDPLPAGVYYAKVDEYDNDDEIAYSIELETRPCADASASNNNVSNAACSPPTLLEPIDGATIHSGSLRWTYNCELAENEFFDVRIWRPGEPHYGVTWTKEPFYAAAAGYGYGVFYWSIAVVRGRDGNPESFVTSEAPPWSYTVAQPGAPVGGGSSNNNSGGNSSPGGSGSGASGSGSSGRSSGSFFPDVPPSHEFYTYIQRLYQVGAVDGFSDGTYRPNTYATRGDVAAVIIRSIGQYRRYTDGRQTFSDVPPSHSFYHYVERLYELGITRGFGDGTYRPNESVARSALAALIVRARGDDHYTYSCAPHFPDVACSNDFYNSIERLYRIFNARGIGLGYSDGSFRPDEPITRGGMAKFIVVGLDL